MDRYNKYQTKQYTHTHTLTHCTRSSWWLVLGWVTNKEDHQLLWFDGSTIEIWSVNKYITITITKLIMPMVRIIHCKYFPIFLMYKWFLSTQFTHQYFVSLIYWEEFFLAFDSGSWNASRVVPLDRFTVTWTSLHNFDPATIKFKLKHSLETVTPTQFHKSIKTY